MKIRHSLWAASVFAMTVFAETGAGAQPLTEQVTAITDLWPAIAACWNPPPGSAGSEITLRFRVTPSGELRGKPVVVKSKLLGAPDVRKEFESAAFKAVANCTPLDVTGSFGGFIARQVLTVRFA